jgi:hypothetical protein
MTKSAFLRTVQSRTARVAIGASTVRGRGNAGTVAASRAFLRSLPLQRFALRNASKFAQALDRTTNDLRARLPRTAQHWGLARKILNIFLRDCLYTTYLAEAYRLQRSERFLELPSTLSLLVSCGVPQVVMHCLSGLEFGMSRLILALGSKLLLRKKPGIGRLPEYISMHYGGLLVGTAMGPNQSLEPTAGGCDVHL